MKAMILAAGRGSRMGGLGQRLPKILLPINGKTLVEHHIERLKQAGITEIVINVSHRAEQIKQFLGDGSEFGVKIDFSSEDQPLETGGGIFQALPLLGDKPFIVMSGDLYTDFPFKQLPQHLDGLAHLVLNDPFAFNLKGDFSLNCGQVSNFGTNKLNFAGIGLYHPDLFKDCEAGCFPISPLLRAAATEGLVSGEYFSGCWYNIGNPIIYQQVKRLAL